MKKVIVTGANGFIGSSFIKKIIKEDYFVIALDISFCKSRLPKSDKICEVTADLNSAESVLLAIPEGKYDLFYHFAWAGVNGNDKANPIVQLHNIEMTINCATVAKHIGCSKFLCAGTIAERVTESLEKLDYTSGGMMYGVAKYMTHLLLETYCKNIDLNFVWMQFSNIYGPGNKTGNLVSYTIGELSKNCAATFGPALQPYDFIYVDDLIEAVFRLGECNTKEHFYYIGSGEPRMLREYLIEIGQLYNKEELIRIGVRPDDGIKYTMNMFETEKLKNDIGNYISKSFSEGVKYTIEMFLEEDEW